MRLSKEAIKEFQKIWQEEFGERISEGKAQKRGEELLSLFKIIYRPIPKKDRKNHDRKTDSSPDSS